MTADWRATLERVAELLDEYQDKAPDDLDRRYLLEPALTLIRGLLAEPQVNPSEAKRFTEADIDRIYRRLDGGTWGTTSKDCIRAVLHASGAGLLAEGEESRKPDQSTWPAHLRDDAPFVVCSGCGRKSWSPESPGESCGMPQPDGSLCRGRFSGGDS